MSNTVFVTMCTNSTALNARCKNRSKFSRMKIDHIISWIMYKLSKTLFMIMKTSSMVVSSSLLNAFSGFVKREGSSINVNWSRLLWHVSV